MKGKYDKTHAMTLTVEDAAKEIGISRHLAWSLVEKGQLRSVRLGKLVRVPRVALTELLEGNDGNARRPG
jgi:excisionase family DNA binding protein